MMALHSSKQFGFVPKTFVLPDQWDDFQEAFLMEEEKTKMVNYSGIRRYNYWICKPAGSSQGKGIRIINDLSKIKNCDQTIV